MAQKLKFKRTTRKKETFSQKLLSLISEPQFIAFENILNEPNFFKIVGRAHYERWHSCFWGWLLDPAGSHMLAHYGLKRLLLLLSGEGCLKANSENGLKFLNHLALAELDDVEVTPNENSSVETSVQGVGRFDIFVSAKATGQEGTSKRLNLLLELKIDSPPIPEQAKKYGDWLTNAHPDDYNFLVFISPKLGDSSQETIGDNRWYCLDYQLLHDKLLIPLLDHPNLNEKVKPFIVQYVKNLKVRHRGVKMAITEEEKRMALALYDKYSEVFDSIYDALYSTGAIDYSISEVWQQSKRAVGRIAVRLGNKVFAGDILRDLFLEILHYLVDEKLILRLPLPWGPTSKRYVLTNQAPAVHPSGRDFFAPLHYNGYTLESHYARDRGLAILAHLCEKLEIKFEVIEA